MVQEGSWAVADGLLCWIISFISMPGSMGNGKRDKRERKEEENETSGEEEIERMVQRFYRKKEAQKGRGETAVRLAALSEMNSPH